MAQCTSRPPDRSLIAAAQRLLNKWSRRLRNEMRRCARDSSNPECVHQLRVATRRLDALVELLSPVCNARRVRRILKQLRRLRRSARHVRDLDVLLDRLESSGDARDDPSALTAELRTRRDDAMHNLRRVVRKRHRKRLQSRVSRLRSDLRTDGGESVPQELPSGESLLRPCIAEFQSASSADLSDVAALHRFRLQGKRLRYTLEPFVDQAETGGITGLMELLKVLQEQLGDINDYAAAAVILDDVGSAAVDAGLQALARTQAACERHRLGLEQTRFLTWWSAGGAAELKGALAGLLADVAPAQGAAD